MTTTLLLKWLNEHLRDGGFRVSSRGCYKRGSFLVVHGLLPRFKFFMKTDKNVCVNSCQIYLQDVVIKEDLVDELTKFGLIFPLPRSTVHGWMLKSGAQFCKVQKSYYTDNHDAVEIKKYRNEFYIPAMENHSRRAAVWTKAPVSEASAESLLDLCSTFNVCHISDLPVCCLGAVNGVEHIKVNSLKCNFIKYVSSFFIKMHTSLLLHSKVLILLVTRIFLA